ncbi:DGD2 [Symbiodinium sp. KB8]|nr:DGD2 [Symbiodinium sp. KB8]
MGMLNEETQSTTETRSSEGEEGGASLVQQLGRTPIDAQKGLPIYSLGPFPRCTEASDLRSRARHVTVITTAALPWTTGPSINPLLRSLHLARNGHRVIFVMPWVRLKEEQAADEELFKPSRGNN